MEGRAPAARWDCHVHVFDEAAPVAPGHYVPQHRPLSAIEALAQSHGVERLVLVQPSVYGTDNTVLLDALKAGQGRHRGVVVLDAAISDAALADMHALGVRGVRFNLVSPVGNGTAANTETAFHRLAPRLRAMGWHVQWYPRPQDLPVIAALHAGPAAAGVAAVLDHLAGMHAGLPTDDAAWQVLAGLARSGAWLKLSGWYRLRADAPYASLDAAIHRAAGLFGPRLVWGSDWPHTSFTPEALPGYASTWQPVARVLTPAQQHLLSSEAPPILYA
ncbi:MAG: amidohydrolase family protein [Pseudomonadota bacterium]